MTPLSGLDDPELAHDEALAVLVADIRTALTTGPGPEITPQLMAVLTRGRAGCTDPFAAPAPVAPPLARPRRRLADRLESTRARLALGLAVASISFLGTGAAGALPGPAQSAFERTASAVGVDLPGVVGRDEDAPAPAGPAPGTPAPLPEGSDPGQPAPEPAPSTDPGDPTGGPPGGEEGPARAPEGGERPGNELSRDAREGRPVEVPAPVPPGRPEGTGPPAGVPAPDGTRGDRPGPPVAPAVGPGAGSPWGAGAPPAVAAQRPPSQTP